MRVSAHLLTASSEVLLALNPRESSRSTSSQVLGTSPGQPLSPPVYLISTPLSPDASTTISAIRDTETVSSVPKFYRATPSFEQSMT